MKFIRLFGLVGLVFLLSLGYLANRSRKPIASADTFDSRFGLIGNSAENARALNAFWGKVVIPWGSDPGVIDQELTKIGPIKLVGLLKATDPASITCKRFVGIGNSCPPKDINQYAKFVFETVNRFKDRIDVWQIEDEIYSDKLFGGTVDDYLAMLQAASLAIKQADPEAKVMVASTNLSGGKPYLERLATTLEHDNLYDMIDLHLSGNVEDIEARAVEFLNGKLPKKPIWVTELRVPGGNYQDLVKSHAVLFSLGVEKIFWFGELDEVSRKAYTLMASLLTRYSLSYSLPESTGLNGGLFEFSAGQPLVIVWSPGSQEVDLAKLLKPRYQVFDLFGRKLPITKAKVTVSQGPLYLIGSQLAITKKQPSARLSIELDKQSYKIGEIGTATILVDAPDQTYAEVQLGFPNDLIRVKRISHTQSDFALVLSENIDNTHGLISLNKARVLQSNKEQLVIATVSFEVLAKGEGSFRLINRAQDNLAGALTTARFAVQ
ncbi:MAG: hypothetical protein WAP74_02070 [Patescibacteria group bacterium]